MPRRVRNAERERGWCLQPRRSLHRPACASPLPGLGRQNEPLWFNPPPSRIPGFGGGSSRPHQDPAAHPTGAAAAPAPEPQPWLTALQIASCKPSANLVSMQKQQLGGRSPPPRGQTPIWGWAKAEVSAGLGHGHPRAPRWHRNG